MGQVHVQPPVLARPCRRGYNRRVPKDIVYFDLETKKTFNDVNHDKARMGMTVGVTYSTRTGRYVIYSEAKVHDLVDQLRTADLVVGHNILNFDYAVLMGYSVVDLAHTARTLDTLVSLEKRLGHRPKLEDVARPTLGVGKTAGGLDAIKWWREGRGVEVARYCCFDVKVTRLVHQFGVATGHVLYTDRTGRRQRIEVDWGREAGGGPS